MRDIIDIGADESDGTDWSNWQPPVVHVKADGHDANDGLTWASAKNTVQAGMDEASVLCGEVWVKAGDYYDSRVVLHSFVYAYGGFAGTETSRSQRTLPIANTSRLDPRTGPNGQPVSYEHGGVVEIKATGPYSAIDGFTIQHGLAEKGGGIYCEAYPQLSIGFTCALTSAPTIAHNTIVSNTATIAGGGIACANGAAAKIDANTVDSNEADQRGGGVSLEVGSDATLTNNVFDANSVTGTSGFFRGGGGVHCLDSDVTIVNSTFAGNEALSSVGGGVKVEANIGQTAVATLINDVFYNNRAAYWDDPENPYSFGHSVACYSEPGALSYCDAFTTYVSLNETQAPGYHYYLGASPDSSFVNPQFYLTGAHPYWLGTSSPLRGLGLNPDPSNTALQHDMEGRDRPGTNNSTDIGAYEDNP